MYMLFLFLSLLLILGFDVFFTTYCQWSFMVSSNIQILVLCGNLMRLIVEVLASCTLLWPDSSTVYGLIVWLIFSLFSKDLHTITGGVRSGKGT